MPTTLRLKGPVRVSHSVNPDDVLSVKRALADLDLYDSGGQPLHGGLDAGLLNGIEAFQRTNKLSVDRVVNPGGETEQKLNAALLRKAQGPAAAATPARAFGLRAPVGHGGVNLADDVQAAKRGLAWAGFYPHAAAQSPSGEPGADLLRGIAAFQARHNLKQDGWMRPGGETERAIDRVIGPMIRAHGPHDPRAPQPGRPLLQPVQEPGGSDVEPPAIVPQREPEPVPPPSFSPDRFPEPLPLLPRRETYLPPPDPADVRRNEALSRLGLPIPLTVGERLIRLRRSEAMSEAEAVAGVPIPSWKADSIELAHWAMWANALGGAPGVGRVQREVYLQIFAAEGGFQPTSDSAVATVAGITGGEEGVLQTIGPSIGVDPGATPRDLTVPQLVSAYRAYFDLDWVLGRAGGAAFLDQIQDVPAAILLADTLFRHGGDAGTRIIQAAINAGRSQSNPDNETAEGVAGEQTARNGNAEDVIPVDGVMGPDTRDAYLAMMANRDTRELLRGAIRAGRDADRRAEGPRHAYMTSL